MTKRNLIASILLFTFTLMFGLNTILKLSIINLENNLSTYKQELEVLKIENQILIQAIENKIEEIKEENKNKMLARITCYNWTGNKMANGIYPKYGYVAVSDRSIPFGTKIIIDGEEFEVGDRTALWVHNKFEYMTVDIYLDNCDMNFGAKVKEIIIK